MAEESNDIFEGYENDLQKAVALIEWQKTEIESHTRGKHKNQYSVF
jgi:hypothetical protein